MTCFRATCAGFRESRPILDHGRRTCRLGYAEPTLQNGRWSKQDDRGGGTGEIVFGWGVGIGLVMQAVSDEVKFSVNGKDVVVGKEVGPHVRLAR